MWEQHLCCVLSYLYQLYYLLYRASTRRSNCRQALRLSCLAPVSANVERHRDSLATSQTEELVSLSSYSLIYGRCSSISPLPWFYEFWPSLVSRSKFDSKLAMKAYAVQERMVRWNDEGYLLSESLIFSLRTAATLSTASTTIRKKKSESWTAAWVQRCDNQEQLVIASKQGRGIHCDC